MDSEPLLPLRMSCVTYTVLCTFDFIVSVRDVCEFTNVLLLLDLNIFITQVHRFPMSFFRFPPHGNPGTFFCHVTVGPVHIK